MRDQRNFGLGNVINISKKLSTTLTHHNQSGGQLRQLANDLMLLRCGISQHGMQGRYQGHLQVFCELDDKAAALTTVYAVFVLQTDYIRIAHVEEAGSETVLIQFILADLESHLGRVAIALRLVIHGNGKTVDSSIVFNNRSCKVSGKGSDSALPRQVVADQGH